jgi:hypothetical protein
MERTHQVSRHHTRLIISAQMPMFCCGALGRDWHFRDIARSQIDFRFWWKNGHAADIALGPGLTLNRHKQEKFAAMHRRPHRPMMC